MPWMSPTATLAVARARNEVLDPSIILPPSLPRPFRRKTARRRRQRADCGGTPKIRSKRRA